MARSPVYSPATHVISGAVAGGIAAWLTVPLDVTKTLLQTRGLSACAEIRGCDSAVKAWRLLYRREGVRAFFRGSRARVLAHMPATAISWSMYEYFKFALGRFHESSAVYGEVLNNGGGDNHAPRDNDRDLAAVGSAPASAPVSH